MDRLLREERLLTASMVKKIAKTGCNVLLVQKSILRDAVTDLSLDYLAKLGILTVRDIEREDVEFIAKVRKLFPVSRQLSNAVTDLSVVSQLNIRCEN